MAFTKFGLASGLAYRHNWGQELTRMERLRQRQEYLKQRQEQIDMRKAQAAKEDAEYVAKATKRGSTFDPYNESRYNEYLRSDVLPKIHSFMVQHPNFRYNPFELMEFNKLAKNVGENQILRDSKAFQEQHDAAVEAWNTGKITDTQYQDWALKAKAYREQGPDGSVPLPYFSEGQKFDYIKAIDNGFSGLRRSLTMSGAAFGYDFVQKVPESSFKEAAYIVYESNEEEWDRLYGNSTLGQQFDSPIEMIKHLGKNYSPDDKYTGKKSDGDGSGSGQPEFDPFYNDVFLGKKRGTSTAPNTYVSYLVPHTENMMFNADHIFVKIPPKFKEKVAAELEAIGDNLNAEKIMKTGHIKMNVPNNLGLHLDRGYGVRYGNQTDQDMNIQMVDFGVSTTFNVGGALGESSYTEEQSIKQMINESFTPEVLNALKDAGAYDEMFKLGPKSSTGAKSIIAHKNKIFFDASYPLVQANARLYNKAVLGQSGANKAKSSFSYDESKQPFVPNPGQESGFEKAKQANPELTKEIYDQHIQQWLDAGYTQDEAVEEIIKANARQ